MVRFVELHKQSLMAITFTNGMLYLYLTETETAPPARPFCLYVKKYIGKK